MGWKRVDWISLAQDSVMWWAVVKKVMNLLGSISAEDFLTSQGPAVFTRRSQVHGVGCLCWRQCVGTARSSRAQAQMVAAATIHSILVLATPDCCNINNKIKYWPSNTPIFIVLAYCTGNMFRLIVKSSSGPDIQNTDPWILCNGIPYTYICGWLYIKLFGVL